MKFVASFSGGKDSTLAFHLAKTMGHQPVALLHTVNEESGRSMSHALPLAFVEAQAKALGVPLALCSVAWKSYEERFTAQLTALARQNDAQLLVTGDIDLQQHRDWEERVAAACGMSALLPLWGLPRQEVAVRFVREGFSAFVAVVDTRRLSAEYVGRPYDMALIEELTAAGIDPCAEAGEFHTAVTDGPDFAFPIAAAVTGRYERDHHAFAEFTFRV